MSADHESRRARGGAGTCESAAETSRSALRDPQPCEEFSDRVDRRAELHGRVVQVARAIVPRNARASRRVRLRVLRESSATADRGASGRSGSEQAVVADLMRTRRRDQRDQPLEKLAGLIRRGATQTHSSLSPDRRHVSFLRHWLRDRRPYRMPSRGRGLARGDSRRPGRCTRTTRSRTHARNATLATDAEHRTRCSRTAAERRRRLHRNATSQSQSAGCGR